MVFNDTNNIIDSEKVIHNQKKTRANNLSNTAVYLYNNSEFASRKDKREFFNRRNECGWHRQLLEPH